MQNNNVNISLDQTTELVCDKCQNKFFHEALYIRKVSGILTGTGQPSYIPIPVFACDNCGNVSEEFLPVEVRKLE